MAETFSSFDKALKNGSLLEDSVFEEEEYDAKNNETFGELEDFTEQDWEQSHEKLSEFSEWDKMEKEMHDFMETEEFDELLKLLNNDRKKYCKPNRRPQRVSNSNTSSRNDSPNHSVPQASTVQSGKICTVEELENNLLKNHQKPKQVAPPPHPNASWHNNYFPSAPPEHLMKRLPPGLPPPPLFRMHHPFSPYPMGPEPPPPGMMRFMPPFMRPPAPSFMYPNKHSNFMNPPLNFPPPMPFMGPGGVPNNAQMYKQQGAVRHDSNNYRQRNGTPTMHLEQNRDEYAGLMTNREKQWLLNIQLLQLNTGTPYFDDYYYTIYKSRKLENSNVKKTMQDRNHYNRNHRSNDRQENNLMQPRVYTPLQFENSLGKLQCGSITAPRKIIDMDIVTPEKDSENATTQRDTRKSKQILLELEGFYTLFLKALDLRNPLAISDMEKLRELKQKQRLRELEAAQTQEQKQEVLKLLQQESVPVVEDQKDYLVKIVNGLLQEDKFASYFNFSKGKMLVIRLLPYLTTDTFSIQLKDLWLKILTSLPLVFKRDSLGDNILPKFYLPFKNYVQTLKMTDILELVSALKVPVKQENSRAPPRTRLYFVLSCKFGVSAVSALFTRVEQLTDEEEQRRFPEWIDFLKNVAETLPSVKDVPTPMEFVSNDVFKSQIERAKSALSAVEQALLESLFTEGEF